MFLLLNISITNVLRILSKSVLCKMTKYNFTCFHKVDLWCLLPGRVNNRGRAPASWETCAHNHEIQCRQSGPHFRLFDHGSHMGKLDHRNLFESPLWCLLEYLAIFTYKP